MKKLVSVLLVIASIFLFASCSGPEKAKVELNEELSAKFADAMSLDEILKDVSKIDMHHKMKLYANYFL